MAKIKICGLKRIEDVKFVNEFLPDFAGFVFAGEKRKISVEEAQRLRKHLDPKIQSVGVFVNEEPDKILELTENNIIDIIQLHGDESQAYIAELKKKVRIPIIKAVRVRDRACILAAQKIGADYLLLDTFQKEVYGGTGQMFDRALIPDSMGDYFLAGGLNENNLKQVLKECNPYAVDLSSGVESNGVKDREKIKKVIEIIRNI